MEWRDVSFTVGEKEILKGVSGLLEPGRVAAIMGPSGCGKTTLLNVLSGRQRSSGKQKGKTASQRVEMKGSITVRGEEKKAKHFQKLVAYVFQDNALPEFETPRDCLNFSAFLRLPKSTSGEERKTVVQHMLDRLRLELCADTIVGSVTRKGLSGGEQKRTAVGIELISKPKMVFLDEPLSGLDSFNAHSLMQSLRQLAASGVPILLTLHQPNSQIFSLLDDLIVMHEGEVCYHGPAEQLASHFELLGHACPEGYSPTDHAMCLVQNESAEAVRRMKDQWRECGAYRNMLTRMSLVQQEAAEQEEVAEDLDTNSETEESETDSEEDAPAPKQVDHATNKHQKGCCATLFALLARDLRRVKRTFVIFLSTYVLQHFMVALAYSLLFFGTGRAESDPDRAGCSPTNFSDVQCNLLFIAHIKFLAMVCFCVIFASVPYAIETLQQERSVFLRERAGGYYEVIPYFLSKMVFEIPQVLLESLAILIGTYWLVGLQGNFFWLLLELMVLAVTSSSMMYVFSAACSTPDKANAYAGLPMTLQFAFSGVLIPIQSMPAGLRWLKWLCPLYYGMNILGTTEFAYLRRGWQENCQAYSGEELPAAGLHPQAHTDYLCRSYRMRLNTLEAYSIRPSEFWWPNMAMCAIMVVGFRSLASILLWRQSRYVH